MMLWLVKQKGVNMDLTNLIFNLSELVQILEETLTEDEIEMFLSSDWGIA